MADSIYLAALRLRYPAFYRVLSERVGGGYGKLAEVLPEVERGPLYTVLGALVSTVVNDTLLQVSGAVPASVVRMFTSYTSQAALSALLLGAWLGKHGVLDIERDPRAPAPLPADTAAIRTRAEEAIRIYRHSGSPEIQALLPLADDALALLDTLKQTEDSAHGEALTHLGDRERLREQRDARPLVPIPMILHCPAVLPPGIDEGGIWRATRVCHHQHVDTDDETGAWATTRHHRKHLCHRCGHVWQPALVPTVGVAALPGAPA